MRTCIMHVLAYLYKTINPQYGLSCGTLFFTWLEPNPSFLHLFWAEPIEPVHLFICIEPNRYFIIYFIFVESNFFTCFEQNLLNQPISLFVLNRIGTLLYILCWTESILHESNFFTCFEPNPLNQPISLSLLNRNVTLLYILCWTEPIFHIL